MKIHWSIWFSISSFALILGDQSQESRTWNHRKWSILKWVINGLVIEWECLWDRSSATWKRKLSILKIIFWSFLKAATSSYHSSWNDYYFNSVNGRTIQIDRVHGWTTVWCCGEYVRSSTIRWVVHMDWISRVHNEMPRDRPTVNTQSPVPFSSEG